MRFRKGPQRLPDRAVDLRAGSRLRSPDNFQALGTENEVESVQGERATASFDVFWCRFSKVMLQFQQASLP